ncbi:hypothetical protein V8E53_011475 [Lactarius tabidus]
MCQDGTATLPILFHCSRSNQKFLPSAHPVLHLDKNMNFFDIFGFCITVLQTYGVVVYLHGLLPRQIIPHVSAKLDDAQETLTRAIKAGAIPHISKYGEDLESFASELALMRIKSHGSPGLFQQIRLAVQHGLTYKLRSLSSQIGAIRLRVELAMDERHLALRAIPPNIVLTSVYIPAGGMQLTGYRFRILTQGFSFRCFRTDDLYYLTSPSTGSHGLNSLDIHWSHQRISF